MLKKLDFCVATIASCRRLRMGEVGKFTPPASSIPEYCLWQVREARVGGGAEAGHPNRPTYLKPWKVKEGVKVGEAGAEGPKV